MHCCTFHANTHAHMFYHFTYFYLCDHVTHSTHFLPLHTWFTITHIFHHCIFFTIEYIFYNCTFVLSLHTFFTTTHIFTIAHIFFITTHIFYHCTHFSQLHIFLTFHPFFYYHYHCTRLLHRGYNFSYSTQ